METHMTYVYSRSIACLLVVVALSGLAAATPVTVYENTTTNTTGSFAPDGFWPFNTFEPNEPMGDQITLDNTTLERTIVQFDLILSSSQLVNLPSLTLAFYDINPNTGFPSSQLWATSASSVAVDGITTVAFSVPSVVVPDSFVWVVGADSWLAGLATYDLPSIGTSIDFYWDHDTIGGQWFPLNFKGDPVANFGAKVLAVPEPGIMAAFAVGVALMIRKKHTIAPKSADS